EIDSLDVADVTVNRGKLADPDGKIGVIRAVTREPEIDVEVLAVVAAPGIVGDRSVCLVQSPVSKRIVGGDSLSVAYCGGGQDGERCVSGIGRALAVGNGAAISARVVELRSTDEIAGIGCTWDVVRCIEVPLIRQGTSASRD